MGFCPSRIGRIRATAFVVGKVVPRNRAWLDVGEPISALRLCTVISTQMAGRYTSWSRFAKESKGLTATPNVPLVMQAQAESAEAGLYGSRQLPEGDSCSPLDRPPTLVP